MRSHRAHFTAAGSTCAGLDMTENKSTVERYLDGFRHSDHGLILSCLADDMEWSMPGAFHLIGKAAVQRELDNDGFVGNPAITVTRMIEENGIVVAEGSLRIRTQAGGVLSAMFCEVFVMQGGRIKQLITYQVQRA
jgi:ketosteroid isomerase-like protein